MKTQANSIQRRHAVLLLPFLLSSFLPFLITGCANPIPPSGGPRDTTPPVIAASSPEMDAVNVDTTTRAVRITFSEYIEIGSAQQALATTPAFAEPPEFDWDGRTLTLTLPTALRENATYLLTFDTDLSDVHGVSLEEPIRLAFATGPELNRGTLTGRVVDASTGGGMEGFDVYAYAAPDSTPPRALPERPLYRTQTDPDGRFLFEYLSEQPYYVIALEDVNRNRRPDPREAFAVPPRPVIFADTTTARGDTMRWLAAARDTLAPEAVNVEPRSARRLAIRFGEPVRLTARQPSQWTLLDSLAGATRTVETIYQKADAPQLVYLRTEPLRAAPHVLYPPAGAVIDTSGNALRADTLRFTAVEVSDTLQTRFVGFLPQGLTPDTTGTYVLLPGYAPGVRFNQPVDSTILHRIVSVETPAGTPRTFTAETADGTGYRLELSPPLQPEASARVAVSGQALGRPDTTFVRTFQRISNRALGELSGVVVAADTSAPLVVQLYAVEGPLPLRPAPFGTQALRTARADPDGGFIFTKLPEGSYRFRAFLDRNGNGRWDPGRIAPYRPAEPITRSARPLTVRPRWEVALKDTMRVTRF